jgi:hypothetical protein
MEDTRAEAIAAWNQYVAPAPQWTKEVPENGGRYIVRLNNGISVEIVVVRLFHNYGKLVIQRGTHTCELDYFLSLFSVEWFPIPEPPLPAEREETP